MPMPSIAQATNRLICPLAAESPTRPTAKTMFETANTPRPPRRSIARPTRGPAKAAINKEIENAANTEARGMPSPLAIGSASTAGR